MEIAATAVDGVRERFRMRLGEPEQVWHFDALLKHVFVDRKRERVARRLTLGVAAGPQG